MWRLIWEIWYFVMNAGDVENAYELYYRDCDLRYHIFPGFSYGRIGYLLTVSDYRRGLFQVVGFWDRERLYSPLYIDRSLWVSGLDGIEVELHYSDIGPRRFARWDCYGDINVINYGEGREYEESFNDGGLVAYLMPGVRISDGGHGYAVVLGDGSGEWVGQFFSEPLVRGGESMVLGMDERVYDICVSRLEGGDYCVNWSLGDVLRN